MFLSNFLTVAKLKISSLIGLRMAYTERTRGEVISLLECWEASYPWPNDPWAIIGGAQFTPREFMQAIKRGGSLSYELINYIVIEARRLNEDPLDYIVWMIKESATMAEEDPV